MAWYAYLAYFFAGVFLANGVPHFVNGIAGNKFQSPFASPRGVGESSPLVNVIWGLANFFIGYVLIFGVGLHFRLDPGRPDGCPGRCHHRAGAGTVFRASTWRLISLALLAMESSLTPMEPENENR